MNETQIVNMMTTFFTKEELKGMHLTAGAAAVLHGVKPETQDIDILMGDPALFRSVTNRLAECNPTHAYFQCGLGSGFRVDSFEIFCVDDATIRVIYERPIAMGSVHGFYYDTMGMLIDWYRFAVERIGRTKDHDNLALVRQFVESKSKT